MKLLIVIGLVMVSALKGAESHQDIDQPRLIVTYDRDEKLEFFVEKFVDELMAIEPVWQLLPNEWEDRGGHFILNKKDFRKNVVWFRERLWEIYESGDNVKMHFHIINGHHHYFLEAVDQGASKLQNIGKITNAQKVIDAYMRVRSLFLIVEKLSYNQVVGVFDPISRKLIYPGHIEMVEQFPSLVNLCKRKIAFKSEEIPAKTMTHYLPPDLSEMSANISSLFRNAAFLDCTFVWDDKYYKGVKAIEGRAIASLQLQRQHRAQIDALKKGDVLADACSIS